MANTQNSTLEASKSWRVLECNPRWGRGLNQPATGREVYIEIDGKWGDAGKDARLLEAAPQLLEALKDLAYQVDRLKGEESQVLDTNQAKKAIVAAG